MVRRNRSWIWLSLLAVLVGGLSLLSGCTSVNDGWQDKPDTKIVVSFPPLYSFVKTVAGDDAQVQCLLTTEGPHGFNPTPQDGVKLKRADRFFVNGLTLDDALFKLKDDSSNRHLLVLPVSSSIPTSQLRHYGHDHDHKHDHKHDHGKGHEGHDHGKYDPHVWLGLPEAVRMVEFIRDELIKIDPNHEAGYTQRARDYIARLNDLQKEGKEKLAGKKDRKLIAFHDSLYYFGRTFDLDIVDTIQVNPGVEPDPAHLVSLVNRCVKENVRVIAVEPQYSSTTAADSLLQEIRKKGVPDAVFVVIDPMETVASEPELKAEFYETKMRQNIDNLARVLK